MYAVCDVHGSCDLAAVTITIGIGLADHKPVVVDDAIQVAPGQSANTLIGDLNVPGSVLDNDADPDGDALSVMKISDLLNASGTLMLDALGFVAYDNDPANPATSDTALYSACDPSGACTAGLVTVSIKSGALDHAPTAEDDAIHIGAYGMATSLVGGATSLVANDTDLDPGETQTLTAHLIMAPEHGRMTINPNGTFVYVNDDPASGADVIQYEACDSEGACDAATVNVVIDTTSPTVTCVLPRQLDVVGDTVSLDLALLFAPPANDSLTYSVANAPPTLSIVGSLLSGTLTASGTFTSTLQAQAVTGGGVASQDVAFQVLAPDDLLLRNGFDVDNPSSICQ
jgi:VCBS repeat-containing protein